MASECVICSAPCHPQAYACDRCRKLLSRVETRRDADGKPRRPDRQARIRALQRAWDPKAQEFRCHYTGVELITDPKRWRDHRYLSFEHQTPGDESSIVVVSALMNRMKTDLSDTEFRRLVVALAASFQGQPFDRSTFPAGSFDGS